MIRTAGTLIVMFFGSTVASAADPPIEATLVSWDGKEVPAVELIDAIAKQAGIPIDRSAVPVTAKYTLKSETQFWHALRNIADATGQRIVVGGKGDRIAFTKKDEFDRPPASVSGPFRIAVKQVSAKADFESGRTTYDVQLDLHWEPRVPVFRTSGLTATVVPDRGRAPVVETDRAKANVEGFRQPLAIRLSGLTRPVTQLKSLTGSVTVTAAEKMLRVTFDDLAAQASSQTVEKVKVALLKFEKVEEIWEARVALTYPPGMPTFESFEAECWLRDNACRLVSPDRSKSFEAKDYLVRIAPNGAAIDYRFPENKARGLLPGKGWRLEVDAPSPLLEFAVPFELKGIILP